MKFIAPKHSFIPIHQIQHLNWPEWNSCKTGLIRSDLIFISLCLKVLTYKLTVIIIIRIHLNQTNLNSFFFSLIKWQEKEWFVGCVKTSASVFTLSPRLRDCSPGLMNQTNHLNFNSCLGRHHSIHSFAVLEWGQNDAEFCPRPNFSLFFQPFLVCLFTFSLFQQHSLNQQVFLEAWRQTSFFAFNFFSATAI